MNSSPPGFSVHGVLQARILEWVAIHFSRGSSWPRNWTLVSCIAGRFFVIWEILHSCINYKKKLEVRQMGALYMVNGCSMSSPPCFFDPASQVALVVKNPTAIAGDLRGLGSIPGSGRAPGGERGSPLQCSCLENPRDRGAWWATVHGVAKSWTRLKWLSPEHQQRMLAESVSGVDQPLWYMLAWGWVWALLWLRL